MVTVRALLCAAFAAVFLLATPASAQECNGFDPTEFNSATAVAEANLTELERLANRVLETKTLTAEDERRADGLMNSYANHLFKAYQIAQEAADVASRTEGAEGDGRVLGDFELVASTHEKRTIELALKMEKVHAGVVQGEIKQASLDLPTNLSPVQQLTQEGQQQLALRPGFQKIVGRSEDTSFSGMCRSAAGAVGELLVPTAEAALIWPCVSPCKNKRWNECWACVSKAGPQAVAAWNDFWSCWNQRSAWWWRAWCVAKFVAKLA